MSSWDIHKKLSTELDLQPVLALEEILHVGLQ